MRNFLLIFLISIFIKLGAQTSPNFTIVITPASCPTCCDGTAGVGLLNPNCNAFAVTWTDTNGYVSSSGILTNCCAGNTYTATIASACGMNDVYICNISYQFFTNISTSFITDISIYPNPTNGIINITDEQLQLQNATIEIKNTLGQIVYLDVYAPQINVSSFPSGIYFITLNNKETKRTIKFVKD